MDKTAIKNFSIWARNKLIADITYKAGLLGITEEGIKDALPQSTQDAEFYDIGTKEPYAIHGEEIKQRKELISAIRKKASQLEYKEAYRNVIEEVAYTWFNRLIAIRFMEVNDYMPAHIRVLSSESGTKLEPDLVTTPFDAEIEFTQQETEHIIQMKNDNQVDALFRFLFIKQCNALNAYLPKLFEKTSDYTELLLNVSVTDQDGIVYHLTHDIKEDDFNISNIGEDGKPTGQVEIIGWMYQYYNTEPKDEAFALLKSNVKITKERIPAATQLFTPDWIVRYMVENSVGRLWLEGHENQELKKGWKYYLDEAEQEADVEQQLKAIREEYKNIKPEEIKVIDPCMGSGHILVYAFDVLMQIYESYGYSQRDAAKSIVENNIYGLDIDDRAFQLAYFAIMMKARSYNRRFLTLGIEPNLCAIQESNGIQYDKEMGDFLLSEEHRETLQYLLHTFVDAKEYGSILNVEKRDYDGFLKAWELTAEQTAENVVMLLWYNECNQIVPMLAKQAKILSNRYDAVVTNPPYMGSNGMGAKLTSMLKKDYPDSKGDLFSVFYERCAKMINQGRYYAMIVPPSILSLNSCANVRRRKIENETIMSLLHMGRGIFGIDFGSTSFVIRKGFIKGYKSSFFRLHQRTFQYIEPEDIQKLYLLAKDNSEFRYNFTQYTTEEGIVTQTVQNNELDFLQIKFVSKQEEFDKVPNCPFTAYALSDNVLDLFKYPKIVETVAFKEGLTTANNDLFLRKWYEIEFSKIAFDNEQDKVNIYVPYNKGGAYRMWYGNHEYVVNWSNNGDIIRNYPGSSFRNAAYQMKAGGTFSAISAGRFSARLSNDRFAFDSKGTMFFSENDLAPVVAYMNSNLFNELLKIVCPTMDFRFGTIQQLPMLSIEYDCSEEIRIAQEDWDASELSWNFRKSPLINGETTLEKAYNKWCNHQQKQFTRMKELMETYNKNLLIKYNLDKEFSYEIQDKDISLHLPELQEDIKDFLSYAVGCIFGRYSLDLDGLVYAGGNWDGSGYNSFLPDKDNIVVLSDEEYLEDDIIGLLSTWLNVVFGEEYLEENLDFIAKALGNKGNTSRDIIRNYFVKDFISHHIKKYDKKPIYWLFDSGKQNGFKALIYMHRYNADTIGNLRVDYLHRMERIYESEINRMQDTIDNSGNAREVTAASKRKEKLQKQLKECQEYDEKIGHLALSRIEIDLDDGVKVNYEKVQTANDGKKYQVLAKI